MQSEPERSFTVTPRHVAIIMDGYGRWAEAQKLPRIEGHRNGAKSVYGNYDYSRLVEETRLLYHKLLGTKKKGD